jgi:hypothetical protein
MHLTVYPSNVNPSHANPYYRLNGVVYCAVQDVIADLDLPLTQKNHGAPTVLVTLYFIDTGHRHTYSQ